PLQQITSLTFDFDDAQEAMDLIEEATRVELDLLLQASRIVPFPEMERIIIFGPEDIQETAEQMINDIMEGKEDYIQNNSFKWYHVQNVPAPRLRELIGKLGGVRIEIQFFRQNFLLLSSNSEEKLNEVINFLNKIDRENFDSISGRSLQWYEIENIPPAQMQNIISKMGYVQIEAFMRQLGYLLLSSKEKDDLDRALKFLNNIDKENLTDASVEVITIDRGDPSRILDKLTDILGTRAVGGGQALTFTGAGIGQDVRALEMDDSILLMGPPSGRNQIKSLISKIQKSLVNPQEFYWDWYSVNAMPIDRLIDLIRQSGLVKVDMVMRQNNVILLRSKDPQNFKEVRELLSDVDKEEIKRGREIITYTPQFVSGRQLASDLTSYFSELDQAREDEGQQQQQQRRLLFGFEPPSQGSARVIHSSENLIIFSVKKRDANFIRDVLEKLDTQVQEKQKVITYFPAHVQASALANAIRQRNLGTVLFSDEERISLMVPNNRVGKLRDMIKKMDRSGKVTRVVYLRHTRASQILPSLQSIQQDMDLNVSFASDQATNSIIFTASQNSVDQVQRVISRLDRWQKQVFIEGIILEYNLNEGQQFRYQWFLNPNR
ncbi:MAG: secretin N-terminal domain-containing protein, partial [bacterium]